MKLKLLKRWIYPNFPRSIEVGRTYYPKHKKVPKSLLAQIGITLYWKEYRKKLYLASIDTTELYSVPKKIFLNGQKLYSNSIIPTDRAKIVIQLKEYFGELITNTSSQFPLLLQTTILCPRNDIHDLDNLRVIYEKCFIDALKSIQRIKLDNGDMVTRNLAGRPIRDDNVDYLSQLRQRWYQCNTSYLLFELYEQYGWEDDRQKMLDIICSEGFDIS